MLERSSWRAPRWRRPAGEPHDAEDIEDNARMLLDEEDLAGEIHGGDAHAGCDESPRGKLADDREETRRDEKRSKQAEDYTMYKTRKPWRLIGTLLEDAR